MKDINRLSDYMEHIQDAAAKALEFVDGQSMEDFLEDERTQMAVVMLFVVIGEASTNIVNKHPRFVDAHPEIPWHKMRTMRNRIAHGYFDIDFNTVWDTVQIQLPDLLKKITKLQESFGDCGSHKARPKG